MKKPFHFFKWSGKKAVALLILTLSIIFVAVDVTLAVIIIKTNTIENEFTPPVLHISLDGVDKIKNTGNVPVYIRAYSVANWLSVEDEHTVLSVAPEEGVDFTVEFKADNWVFANDQFYYYKHVLMPGDSIPLFTEVNQLKERTGYELHLEIIATGIQAEPIEAINESWPAVTTVKDGDKIILAPVNTPETEG